jgi:hypothetical protein
MSELSPKARDLVSAGKGALRPSDADRERVLGALQARIGAPTAAPDHATVSFKSAGVNGSWAWVAAGLVGAGIVGAILVRPNGTAPDASASVPSPQLSVGAPPPLVVERLSAVPEAEPALSAEPDAAVAPPASRRARDRLAEEVAILGRAAGDLRAGRAADALSALNEHQSKFPKGALAQERRAARAEALCALGRFAEARSELSRLPKASPQAVRATAFCDKRSSN